MALIFPTEGWRHGTEGAHGDCVDEEHQTEREIQFGVFGSPCKELS